MRRFVPVAIAGAAAACVLAVSAPASAQAWLKSESTWRQHTSEGRPTTPSMIDRFTFEMRFGAYAPEVDEEFGGPGPFADYFGTGAQFYFGLEVDWTPLRIPYVGRFGPGFGWGFTTMSTKAKVPGLDTDGAATEVEAGESTSLTIHPMHLSGVLRIDEIARRTVIPIVPYAKLGFGFAPWSSGTSTGTSGVGTDCTATTPVDCVKGEGLSIGSHLALGGMLGLNWLDPRSGAMARETAGIKQAYIFGEWMWDNLDSSFGKPAMHVGTSTWVLGLALDL